MSARNAKKTGKNPYSATLTQSGNQNALKGAMQRMQRGSGTTSSKKSAPVGKKSQNLPPGIAPGMGRILRPQAATRWLLPSLAAITPQYIEMTLRGALAGSHVQQWELFDLMLDSWPELSACAQELTDLVSGMNPVFSPWCEEGEKPTESALEKRRLVSSAWRSMKPKATADENNSDGTIADLVDGWFRGVTALEVDWQVSQLGGLGRCVVPRATFWVHPVNFAWNSEGELGLRSDARGLTGSTSTQPLPSSVAPFPDHKFLVGIHKAKAGTALGGAMLRPLAWWWCAANFASDWVLNLAQVFGLPFRWANYDTNAPQDTIDAICSMLQNMGSAGWAAFPAGTTLELKDTPKGSDHSPQGELLDRADRYARLVILGQTMSGSHGSMGKGGGQAFGTVEEGVKEKRGNACAKYVAGVINTQLIPSILTLNYGDDSECPEVQFLNEKEGGLPEAQRDQVLIACGLPVGVNFMRQKYNIPAPDEDEEIMKPAQTAGPVQPPKPPEETDPLQSKDAGVPGDLTKQFLGALKDAESELPFPVEAGAFDALFRLEDDAQFDRGLQALLKHLQSAAQK
jgi:phage gp29-like protein